MSEQPAPQPRKQILQDLANLEAASSSEQVTEPQIHELWGKLNNLYAATFGHSKTLPFEVLRPGDRKTAEVFANDRYINTPYGKLIPRGKYGRYVGAVGTSITDITDVVFDREFVTVILGDHRLIAPQRPLGVYKVILAHELAHAQMEQMKVVGQNPPPLTAEDLGVKGPITHVQGFKASYFTPDKKIHHYTYNLEEYAAQYIAMHLLDAFKQPDPVLEIMKKANIGIDAVAIEGAEALNSLLNGLGIQAPAVEGVHNVSDIRGLNRIINTNDRGKKGIARELMRAGTDTNDSTSLARMKILARQYGKRK